MAFTIIPGSSTAPTTYEGTDGVDAAAIVSLPNGSTGVDVFAEGADDLVNWGIQLANSSIRGGDGNDLLTPNIIAGATLIASFVNGNAGEDTLGGNIQLGISATITSVLGGQGNDVIYSNNLQSSRLNGNLGDDEIFVGFGIADDKSAINATVNIANSQIFGGQGDDLISITGGGSSVVRGYFSTVVDGNLGDDEIIVNLAYDAAFQNSLIAGGDGNDLIDAAGEFNDGYGSEVDLVIEGGEGDDEIYGGYEDDVIDTGDGRNFVEGNSGDDLIVGGEGEDTIDGGYGEDTVLGGADADIIFGNSSSDLLDGEAGDDYIDGEDGGDDIIGGTGDDTLYGDEGSDTIDGGDDNDIIIGGSDADELTGGDGDNLFVQLPDSTGFASFIGFSTANLDNGDRFVFEDGPDVITDWSYDADKIETGVVNFSQGAPGSLSYFTAADEFTNYAVRGNFDTVNNIFIVGANGGDGNDILVFTTGSDDDFDRGNISNFTVLAGAGSSTVDLSSFV